MEPPTRSIRSSMPAVSTTWPRIRPTARSSCRTTMRRPCASMRPPCLSAAVRGSKVSRWRSQPEASAPEAPGWLRHAPGSNAARCSVRSRLPGRHTSWSSRRRVVSGGARLLACDVPADDGADRAEDRDVDHRDQHNDPDRAALAGIDREPISERREHEEKHGYADHDGDADPHPDTDQHALARLGLHPAPPDEAADKWSGGPGEEMDDRWEQAGQRNTKANRAGLQHIAPGVACGLYRCRHGKPRVARSPRRLHWYIVS